MLADTGSVAQAARRVGMSRQSAYRLRRHPDARDFRIAWDLALAEAGRQVEQLAIERALNGEVEEYIRDGIVVAERRRPCDARLLVQLLKRSEQHQPKLDAVTRELAALRQIVDSLPDRQDWLQGRLDPQHFQTMERLTPPLTLIEPSSSPQPLTGRRPRLKKLSPDLSPSAPNP